MESSKIYLGDNNVHMDSFPAKSVNMILTSPPYDDLRNYHGYVFDFERTAWNCFRILEQNGVLVWNVADMVTDFQVKSGEKILNTETLNSFRQALFFQSIGFSVRTMIFEKENYMPVNEESSHYANAFEYIFVCTKGGLPKTSNLIKVASKNSGQTGQKTRWKQDGSKEVFTSTVKEMKVKGNIFGYNVGNANADDKTGHEAVFPELFARDMIYSYSNKGDLIYDPFGGSGTTAKVADKLGRKWNCSEISEKNCDKIVKRLTHYGIKHELMLEL